MKSLSTFKTDTNGQAYTIEAFISAILLIVVVLFISPSFATPVSNAEIDDAVNTNQEISELESLVSHYQEKGAVKAAVLNYNVTGDQWAYDADISYPNQNVSSIREYPDTGSWDLAVTNDPTLSEFISQIEDFEDRQNVAVEVYVEHTNKSGTITRTPLVSSANEQVEFGKVTHVIRKQVTLYGTDIPQSYSDSHAIHSSTTAPAKYISHRRTLTEVADNSSLSYYVSPYKPIDEFSTHHETFNTVTVLFVIRK